MSILTVIIMAGCTTFEKLQTHPNIKQRYYTPAFQSVTTIGLMPIVVPEHIAKQRSDIVDRFYWDILMAMNQSKQYTVINVLDAAHIEQASVHYSADVNKWFFDEGSHNDRIQQITVRTDLADAVMTVVVDAYEPGFTLNDSWFEISIHIMNTNDRHLLYHAVVQGFYAALRRDWGRYFTDE